jgi:hypothetical protein
MCCQSTPEHVRTAPDAATNISCRLLDAVVVTLYVHALSPGSYREIRESFPVVGVNEVRVRRVLSGDMRSYRRATSSVSYLVVYALVTSE